jgi:hypothetical protein
MFRLEGREWLVLFFSFSLLWLPACDSTSHSKGAKTLASQQGLFFTTSLGPLEHHGHPHLLLTVNTQTTFVTEPLDENGYVDFVGAINERARDGVTIENNAALLFCKAGLGRAELQPELLGQFTEMIGGNPFSGIEKSFQSIGTMSDEERSQLEESLGKPWSADQFPLVAKWLD